jgi:hypothetical protein
MGVTVGQPGPVATHKLPQLPVAPDLPGARVINNHLARPHNLQSVRVTLIECVQVRRHGVSQTGVPSLVARQLGGVGKVREPGHCQTYPATSSPAGYYRS